MELEEITKLLSDWKEKDEENRCFVLIASDKKEVTTGLEGRSARIINTLVSSFNADSSLLGIMNTAIVLSNLKKA